MQDVEITPPLRKDTNAQPWMKFAMCRSTEKHDCVLHRFQILERLIRSHPDSLLCTLMDDPAREVKYGSIRIPSSIGREETLQEVATRQQQHVRVSIVTLLRCQ
eukprot:4781387-Amphidinium_carterae.1